MTTGQGIWNVLGRPWYRNAFFAFTIAIGFLLMVSSNVIVLSVMELNPATEPVRLGLLLVMAVLVALNLTVFLYRYQEQRTIGKGLTLAGAFPAFLTTACPVCQPIWLVWLGLGSATAFLADWGVYMALISIGLLGLTLYVGLKTTKACEVK